MLLLDKQVAILDLVESVCSDLIRTVSSIQFVHGHTSGIFDKDGEFKVQQDLNQVHHWSQDSHMR